jgi:O-antigen/teichoic acid export membrane protein
VLEKFISPASKKVAYNTLAQTVRQFATLVLGLITTALITRYLGRAGYGDYSLAHNFMLFFTLGADFGLNAIVVREITRKERQAQHYLENLISLRLLLSLAFIFVGIAMLIFTPYSPLVERAAIIFLLALIPSSLSRTSNAVYQANFRYDLSTIACVSGQLITFLFVLLAVQLKLGLLYMVLAALVGELLVMLLNFSFLKKFGLRFSIGGDCKLWKTLLLSALPLGMMLIFSQINTKTDLFLLSLVSLPKSFGLGSQETVGIYSLAYRIFKNAVIIPTFFMNAFFPMMVADHHEDRARFARRFKKASAGLFALSLLVAVSVLILAPWVVRVIAGPGFEHSVIALRILLLGLPFFYLSSPLQWFLVTVGGEKILPLIYGSAAGLSIVLNLLLIPRFSYQISAAVVVQRCVKIKAKWLKDRCLQQSRVRRNPGVGKR